MNPSLMWWWIRDVMALCTATFNTMNMTLYVDGTADIKLTMAAMMLKMTTGMMKDCPLCISSFETWPIPRLWTKALKRPDHVSAWVYSIRWKLTEKNVMPLLTATVKIPVEYGKVVSTKHALDSPIRVPLIKNGDTRLPARVVTHRKAKPATIGLLPWNTAEAQKKNGTVWSGRVMAPIHPTALARDSQLSGEATLNIRVVKIKLPEATLLTT